MRNIARCGTVHGRPESAFTISGIRTKGYAISAAAHAAGLMAQDHKSHLAIGGRPAVIAARALADHHATTARQEAAQFTLQRLLEQYCDYLQGLGRSSHRDARSIFKIHVVEAWPAIAALPANQIAAEQIADMMRKLLELGKGRTANKLRSYMRSDLAPESCSS